MSGVYRAFVCLTAFAFNPAHWGLPYLAPGVIFVRCALGILYFFLNTPLETSFFFFFFLPISGF